MSTEVRCTISDCEYWANDNYCASSGILITHGSPYEVNKVYEINEKVPSRPAQRWGANAYHLAETPIRTIEESYCRTFVKKGQNHREAAEKEPQ